jgi:hypothetical protein
MQADDGKQVNDARAERPDALQNHSGDGSQVEKSAETAAPASPGTSETAGLAGTAAAGAGEAAGGGLDNVGGPGLGMPASDEGKLLTQIDKEDTGKPNQGNDQP